MAIEAAASERRPLFQDTLGWYLGISAYWFATSFKWFILLLLLPIQLGRFAPDGAENTTWGLVVSIGAVEAMIGPAVFGYLSDRCTSRFGRRRPFVAVGAALTALALLFLGQAHSLWMMVLGYLFLQISDDVGTGPYAAIVPDLVPEENRGRAGGVLSLLQLSAQIAAALVGIALARNLFLIYVVIAAINIVCAGIVWVTARERRADIPVRAPESRQGKAPGFAAKLSRGIGEWFAPWREQDFRWVWFTRFLIALGWSIIVVYVANYLRFRVRDFTLPGLTLKDPLIASIVIALAISLSGAASAVVAGKLADRIGRKRIIVYAGWLMFATLVPFALIPVFSVIVLLALFFGIGYGAYISASWAMAADVLPSKEDSGKDMGIWQMSVVVPQFFTGLTGSLIDMGNRSRPGLGYTLAFLLSAGAFLAGSLLVRRVRGST